MQAVQLGVSEHGRALGVGAEVLKDLGSVLQQRCIDPDQAGEDGAQRGGRPDELGAGQLPFQVPEGFFWAAVVSRQRRDARAGKRRAKSVVRIGPGLNTEEELGDDGAEVTVGNGDTQEARKGRNKVNLVHRPPGAVAGEGAHAAAEASGGRRGRGRGGVEAAGAVDEEPRVHLVRRCPAVVPVGRHAVVPHHEEHRILLQDRREVPQKAIQLRQLLPRRLVTGSVAMPHVVQAEKVEDEDVPRPLPAGGYGAIGAVGGDAGGRRWRRSTARQLRNGVAQDAVVDAVQVLHVKGGESERAIKVAGKEPRPRIVAEEPHPLARTAQCVYQIVLRDLRAL
mmetsp:Transcript_32225/g.90259  ORF Transcript_32225/g.90259 Transcript_32225/m.90259 type:complete len:338 (+) Transcript_32225:466-1479(+)